MIYITRRRRMQIGDSPFVRATRLHVLGVLVLGTAPPAPSTTTTHAGSGLPADRTTTAEPQAARQRPNNPAARRSRAGDPGRGGVNIAASARPASPLRTLML